MEEYKRFTVSLPSQLYEELEAFRKKLGISRSDFIRKAIHSFMISEENVITGIGNVVGCISIIMSHKHFELKHKDSELKGIKINHNHSHEIDHEQDLHDHDYVSRPIYANIQQTDEILKTDIQHHFHGIIISTLHVHLEFEKCLEIIAVSGPVERVKKLKEDLQRLRSVISTGFFIIDKDINTNIED